MIYLCLILPWETKGEDIVVDGFTSGHTGLKVFVGQELVVLTFANDTSKINGLFIQFTIKIFVIRFLYHILDENFYHQNFIGDRHY